MLFLLLRMRPQAKTPGQHPDSTPDGFDAHPMKSISEQIVPLRFDTELKFANVTYFEKLMIDTLARVPKAQAIFLIGGSINENDVSGEETLREIAERLDQMGGRLYLSGLKHRVMEVLERAHIHDTLSAERFFRSEERALRDLQIKYDAPLGANGMEA